ncbi:MAG TPA: ABC transporter permease subunit [Myxococcales bacterium]|nr:ABC transporter permease subunit [Myxococcales bacterium]
MRRRELVLVAAREVREAVRSRWFALSAASFLLLSLGLSLLGLSGAERSGLAGFDRTTAGLLNLALLFVPLLGLSLGALGIAGEMEDGSLASLLALPLTRMEVYVGKYLGLLVALAAAIATGFGASGILVATSAGGGDAAAFLSLAELAVLLAAVSLAVGALLSVALGSRARAAGAAFGAWIALVYLSDLGSIGLVVARNLGPDRVLLLSLFNPVEQARVLGTLALTRRPELLGIVGLYGQDQFGYAGLVALLLGALALWAVVALLAGARVFRKAVVS